MRVTVEADNFTVEDDQAIADMAQALRGNDKDDGKEKNAEITTHAGPGSRRIGAAPG